MLRRELKSLLLQYEIQEKLVTYISAKFRCPKILLDGIFLVPWKCLFSKFLVFSPTKKYGVIVKIVLVHFPGIEWNFWRDWIRQQLDIFSCKLQHSGSAQHQQQRQPRPEALQHPCATQTRGPEVFQHLNSAQSLSFWCFQNTKKSEWRMQVFQI